MTDRPAGRLVVEGDPTALDPFAVPAVTHALAEARPRARVVVSGTVAVAEEVAWVGGPVLEVTLVDGTGRLTLVFFGRRHVGGMDVGRRVVVAGTVGTHLGRRVLRNPQTWLLPLRRSAGWCATERVVAGAGDAAEVGEGDHVVLVVAGRPVERPAAGDEAELG